MSATTTTYTIGRDSTCNIRIPDTPGHKDVGRIHAAISVEGSDIFISAEKAAYQVWVDRFKVKRKMISPDNEISIGRNFKFKLHHYFNFSGNKMTGLRKRENDFSEEFKTMEKNWKGNYKKQQELQNRFSPKDLPVLILLGGIAIAEYYSFASFYSVRLFSVAIPVMFFIKERKRKKIGEKIKKENTCPKCHEYLDAKWEEVKEKGGHTCGAFW